MMGVIPNSLKNENKHQNQNFSISVSPDQHGQGHPRHDPLGPAQGVGRRQGRRDPRGDRLQDRRGHAPQAAPGLRAPRGQGQPRQARRPAPHEHLPEAGDRQDAEDLDAG